MDEEVLTKQKKIEESNPIASVINRTWNIHEIIESKPEKLHEFLKKRLVIQDKLHQYLKKPEIRKLCNNIFRESGISRSSLEGSFIVQRDKIFTIAKIEITQVGLEISHEKEELQREVLASVIIPVASDTQLMNKSMNFFSFVLSRGDKNILLKLFDWISIQCHCQISTNIHRIPSHLFEDIVEQLLIIYHSDHKDVDLKLKSTSLNPVEIVFSVNECCPGQEISQIKISVPHSQLIKLVDQDLPSKDQESEMEKGILYSIQSIFKRDMQVELSAFQLSRIKIGAIMIGNGGKIKVFTKDSLYNLIYILNHCCFIHVHGIDENQE